MNRNVLQCRGGTVRNDSNCTIRYGFLLRFAGIYSRDYPPSLAAYVLAIPSLHHKFTKVDARLARHIVVRVMCISQFLSLTYP